MTKIQCFKDQFLSHCKYEKNLSPHSLKAYSIDLFQFQQFIRTNFPFKEITELDKHTIRDYLISITTQHKPKTIKRKLATLKVFMNYLEYEDVILTNPFRKLRLRIGEGKQLPKTIEFKNIRRLFSYLYTKKGNSLPSTTKNLVRDIAILELLFATGMRVGEISNMRPEDINLAKGEVLVRGKGNRERLIPIPHSEVIHSLIAYHQLFKDKISDAQYFFVNRLDQRLSEQSIRLMIYKHNKTLHISQHITPHMFRHSLATLLLENGVDIRYIQNILGHSTISTTQIYAQVNEAPKRKILRLKHPRRQLTF